MRIVKKRELNHLLKKKLYNKFPDLELAIRQPKFTINDVGVEHRWITNWDKDRLLFNKYEPGKWRKFNLIEYVWLKIVIQLREFNVPLATIKNFRDNLHFKADIKNEEVMRVAKETAIALVQENHPNLDAETLVKETFASREFKEKANEMNMSWLEAFIMDALLLKNHFAFLVNTQGEWMPFKDAFIEEYRRVKGFSEFMQRSHVSISLSQILADFISTKDLNLVHGELFMINDEEREVIKTLREEKVKSVKVKLNEDQKIEHLEITKEQKVDKASRIVEFMMKKGYQKITLKTQDGHIVFCENTYKKKL